MKDWLHSVLKIVDYERGKIAGILVAIVVVAVMAGCPLTTKSPLSGATVTPAEWVIEVQKAEVDLGVQKAEIEKAMALYDAKVKLLADQGEVMAEEYARQAEMRQKFFDLAGGVATTLVTGGAISWAEILTSVLAIGSIGVAAGGVYDSKRKNAVIAAEKAKVPTS